MVTLAQNKAMNSCVLLAGDEDLRVGVQLTQVQGVRVHLLGIKSAKKSQSDLLRQEADTTHEWNSSDIKSFLFDIQKLPANITSLNEVGAEVANQVPQNMISNILTHSDGEIRIPYEYFKQIMYWGRLVTKKGKLDDSQQKEVVNAFISHLKARNSRKP